jgi:hypothetical protein
VPTSPGMAAFLRSLLCVTLFAATGCGPVPPALAPIKGSVTRAGNPLAEAKIVLHPLEPQPAGLPKPIAYADGAGNFSVTTLSHGDGALPGNYTVTVELRALRRAGEEEIRDGKNLLPPRFADPQTSQLKKEVLPGENRWEPIEIPAR